MRHCTSKKERLKKQEVIIPQEVIHKINGDGEKYAIIKTPDGNWYSIRNGIVFNQEGEDKGRPRTEWLAALGIV